jgi:hypothetical protein
VQENRLRMSRRNAVLLKAAAFASAVVAALVGPARSARAQEPEPVEPAVAPTTRFFVGPAMGWNALGGIGVLAGMQPWRAVAVDVAAGRALWRGWTAGVRGRLVNPRDTGVIRPYLGVGISATAGRKGYVSSSYDPGGGQQATERWDLVPGVYIPVSLGIDVMSTPRWKVMADAGWLIQLRGGVRFTCVEGPCHPRDDYSYGGGSAVSAAKPGPTLSLAVARAW